MFGLSALETRLALYGALLAAIGIFLVWERAHLINEGEARIKAQDESARTAQKAEDAKVSAGVINDLNQRLSSALQPVPVPIVRLCSAPGSVRAVPASSGTKPSVADTTRTSTAGVPQGTAGIDIGADLQNALRASQVIAIYRDETWDWSVRSAASLPPK